MENADELEIHYKIDLGRWESFFVKRLMAKGPDELQRICDGKSPLFNMVVNYKWRQDSFVKEAHRVARGLRFVKLLGDETYQMAKSAVLETAKSAAPYECAYKEFKSIIEKPGLKHRFENVVNDTFAYNPMLNDAALRICGRTEELEKYDLPYNADYDKPMGKSFDLMRLRALLLWAEFRGLLPFRYMCVKHYLKTLGAEICHGASICFWPYSPDIHEFFEDDVLTERYNLALCQDALCDMKEVADKVLQTQKQKLNQRYDDVKRYKNLIATRQLSEFRKK